MNAQDASSGADAQPTRRETSWKTARMQAGPYQRPPAQQSASSVATAMQMALFGGALAGASPFSSAQAQPRIHAPQARQAFGWAPPPPPPPQASNPGPSVDPGKPQGSSKKGKKERRNYTLEQLRTVLYAAAAADARGALQVDAACGLGGASQDTCGVC